MTQKFTDRYGNTFKVDVKNHLVKFLNPTSRGTKYYDVPPDKNIKNSIWENFVTNTSNFTFI